MKIRKVNMCVKQTIAKKSRALSTGGAERDGRESLHREEPLHSRCVGEAGPAEEWHRDDGPAARFQQLLARQHFARHRQCVCCEVMGPVHLNGDLLI